MHKFFDARGRAWLVLSLLLVIFGISSCGRVAPSYEPGTIEVTSSSNGAAISGAAISIDGVVQEETTPHTFTLESGQYEIAVTLDGWFADPLTTTVNLGPAENAVRHFEMTNTAPTILSVTSDPLGAEIFINDETESRGVTPMDITIGSDLESVSISLELEGYYSPAEALTIPVEPYTTNIVAAGDIPLRAKKTVLLEGFSNANCPGCPSLTSYVEGLMHQEGYGLDRVVFTKFSMSWPHPQDPHHLYNVPENNDRMFYYQEHLQSIPVLINDGMKAEGTGINSLPLASELTALVDHPITPEPGFLIDCEADFSNNAVPFTVTLTAMEDVTLSGLTLYVALIQSLVEYEEPPVTPNNGETAFHWLFRDRLDTPPTLENMTAGQTQEITGNLVRDEWDLDTLHILAFLQNNSTKEVYQAGISAVTQHAPAALFINSDTQRPALREDIR